MAMSFQRNGYVFSAQWLCLFSTMAMPFQRNGYAFSAQWLCLFCAMAMPFLNKGIVILTRRDSHCEPSVVIQYKLHCYFLGGVLDSNVLFYFLNEQACWLYLWGDVFLSGNISTTILRSSSLRLIQFYFVLFYIFIKRKKRNGCPFFLCV